MWIDACYVEMESNKQMRNVTMVIEKTRMAVVRIAKKKLVGIAHVKIRRLKMSARKFVVMV